MSRAAVFALVAAGIDVGGGCSSTMVNEYGAPCYDPCGFPFGDAGSYSVGGEWNTGGFPAGGTGGIPAHSGGMGGMLGGGRTGRDASTDARDGAKTTDGSSDSASDAPGNDGRPGDASVDGAPRDGTTSDATSTDGSPREATVKDSRAD